MMTRSRFQLLIESKRSPPLSSGNSRGDRVSRSSATAASTRQRNLPGQSSTKSRAHDDKLILPTEIFRPGASYLLCRRGAPRRRTMPARRSHLLAYPRGGAVICALLSPPSSSPEGLVSIIDHLSGLRRPDCIARPGLTTATLARCRRRRSATASPSDTLESGQRRNQRNTTCPLPSLISRRSSHLWLAS